MRYISEVCETCGKKFVDGDDVVVCPICGTPHHRSCYEKEGHCVNENKHGNFEWKPTHVEKPQPTIENLENDPEKMKDFLLKKADIVEITGEDKIGNLTAKEYGSFVQKKTEKYIPEFMKMEKSNKKLSVNLAPLFFPRLWLFYRKMYLLGLLLVIIPAIILSFTHSDNVKVYKNSLSVIKEFKDKVDAKEITASNYAGEYKKMLAKMPEPSKGMKYSNRFINISSIILAFFGNYIYKLSIQKKLKYLKNKYSKDKDKLEKFTVYFGGVSFISMIIGIILMYMTSVLPVHIYLIEQLKSLF